MANRQTFFSFEINDKAQKLLEKLRIDHVYDWLRAQFGFPEGSKLGKLIDKFKANLFESRNKETIISFYQNCDDLRNELIKNKEQNSTDLELLHTLIGKMDCVTSFGIYATIKTALNNPDKFDKEVFKYLSKLVEEKGTFHPAGVFNEESKKLAKYSREDLLDARLNLHQLRENLKERLRIVEELKKTEKNSDAEKNLQKKLNLLGGPTDPERVRHSIEFIDALIMRIDKNPDLGFGSAYIPPLVALHVR